MQKNILLFITLSFFFYLANAQDTVPGKIIIKESFSDTNNQLWTQVNNQTNSLKIESGYYVMQRLDNQKPYASLYLKPLRYTNFLLSTSIRIDNRIAGVSQIAGIMFMVQPSGKDGYMLEINDIGNFRVRQINAGYYLYTSGAKETNGWVKNKAIRPAGNFNKLDVMYLNGKYVIIINGTYVYSFFNGAYTSGGTGFFIGPKSKISSNYFLLFDLDKKTDSAQTISYSALDSNVMETNLLKETTIDSLPIQDSIQQQIRFDTMTYFPSAEQVIVDTTVVNDSITTPVFTIKAEKESDQLVIDSLLRVISEKNKEIERLKKESVSPQIHNEITDRYNKLFVEHDSLIMNHASLLVEKAKLSNRIKELETNPQANPSTELMELLKETAILKEKLKLIEDRINKLGN